MKVLYISDSLGVPIHPRGIFNFSVSLVEILRDAGASVDLVVEGAGEFSLEDRFGALKLTSPEAANSMRLSEIHRYFNQGQFGFRWGYRTARIRFWAKRSRGLISAWLRLRERMNYRPNIPVLNDPGQIDFVPPKSEHLNLFEHLIVKQGFYSSSMSRANLGLPPPTIEVAGYDLAIVDTPHFIKLQGIAPERILAVVHDLIPLRDPTMDANWRNLFMRKLDATLALGSNLVFVSRCTQRAFRASFPRHAALREFIFYPAIRRSLMRNAELPPAERSAQSLVDPFVIDPPRVEDSPVKSKKRNKNRLRGGAPIPAAFDRALPFFITATSDEPRKNIGAVVTAFRQFLHGRANVVVLGEIDARRYDSNASANVYFPGYVSDAQKAAFFRNARGALFASLSEGFGIPIVEGAVMGLPVICSDIEVFREVAGDNAFYFDPHAPASLASAVEEALADPATARARAAALKESALARFSQAAVGAHVRVALGELGLRL